MRGLICVAHPDDETLFFGGLILENPDIEWTILCVTDGNGNGTGEQRIQELQIACASLGVRRCETFDFVDQFDQRIDISRLTLRLQNEFAEFDVVYTHGILGEYGHPHHQDVCIATHRAYKSRVKVWSVAFCIEPDVRIALSAESFEKKAQILSGPYRSETQKFLNLIPASATEAFACLTFEEVEHIHGFWLGKHPLDQSKMGRHAWLYPYLSKGHWSNVANRFFGVYFSGEKQVRQK